VNSYAAGSGPKQRSARTNKVSRAVRRATERPDMWLIRLGSSRCVAVQNGGYSRVRASVFLTRGDRTSGVEGIRQVLPDTGEISRVPVFKFLSDTQTGELRHRLNMRPCGSIGAVRPGPPR
jgi:hypothetical protein